MKFAILFSLLAFCAAAAPRSEQGIESMVSRHGYPVQSYKVNTVDGYELEFFRMSAKTGKDSKEESQEESNEKPKRANQAVLLMPGFLSNSEDFVSGGPTVGLAFILADMGHDVYLGNSRGSIYGQKHMHLNPKKDAAFWRFSWHEVGTRDLPAIIDKILDISGQEKIQYLGHMEGSTAFFIMLSEMEEYNSKIEKAIALGPIAFMKNSNNEIINKIQSYDRSWFAKHLGLSTFTPSTELINDVETKCINENYEERICRNAYFLLNGYNSRNFNMTTVERRLPNLPSYGSVRELLHLVLLRKTGDFVKYSEDFTKQPSQYEKYDLSKVRVPMYIMYAPRDKLSTQQDVQQLLSVLPNVDQHRRYDELSNNLDFIFMNRGSHKQQIQDFIGKQL